MAACGCEALPRMPACRRVSAPLILRLTAQEPPICRPCLPCFSGLLCPPRHRVAGRDSGRPCSSGSCG